MKRILITLFSMCLCLTALGINITNYPGTNAFDSSMWFLLSKPAARTNFNLPGDYVASTSDLNSASNSILGQMPTTNGFVDASVTNGLYGTEAQVTNALGSPILKDIAGNAATATSAGGITGQQALTNGHSVTVTLNTNFQMVVDNVGTANGLKISEGSANTFIATNGVVGIGKVPTAVTGSFPVGSMDLQSVLFWDGGNNSVTAAGVTVGGSGDGVAVSGANGYIKGTSSTGKIEWTNSTGRFYYDGSTGNLIVSGTLTATNGINQMIKPSFFTNFTCTTNLQTYLCNGTNQLVTLPNAANVPNVVYRFAVTNAWASVIITNATGAQTIRDGTSLSFTHIGIGSPAFFSDGAHWWPAAKTKSIFANSQFSCSTNIPLTSANTSYPVTFDSTDYNNSQGIALLAGTNGLASKMWITNSGAYMFSPSIVMNFDGADTITLWFKKDGVNIPASATILKGAAGGSIRVLTVPFMVSVTNAAAYEIWAQANGAGNSFDIQAAGGAAPNDYPLTPSVICPVTKISDLWP